MEGLLQQQVTRVATIISISFLAACGGGGNNSKPETQTPQPEQSDPAPSAEPVTPTPTPTPAPVPEQPNDNDNTDNSGTPSPTDEQKQYEALKKNFLNVPRADWKQIDFASFTPTAMKTLADSYLGYGAPLKQSRSLGFYQRADKGWGFFGYNNACKAKNGDTALCFTNTGGTRGGIGLVSKYGNCGEVIGSPVDMAKLDEKICRDKDASGKVTPSAWSSFNWWVGLGSNFDYVSDHFENATEQPLNRFCFEMELPVDRLALNPSDRGTYLLEEGNPFTQIVNQSVAHDNAKGLQINLGTYTATRSGLPNRTKDEEFGGSYQNGGSHFYHNPTSYKSIVPDKIYFYDKNSFIFCAGDMPNGVRSGMRPNYSTNPLYMLGGVNEDGETNAVSYWNQMGRVYVRYIAGVNSKATYPLDLTFKRIFMTYEPNDIFMMQDNGAVLSEQFAEAGDKVLHKLTLYNMADEERTYRLGMNMNTILPFTRKSKNFKLYHDTNANGEIDASDIELEPTKTFKLAANTDMELIAWHDTASMESPWIGLFTAHGRKYVHGSFYVQEVGRLRSASFGIRTWKKQPNEQVDMDAWKKISRYKNTEITLALKENSTKTDFKISFNLNGKDYTLNYRPTTQQNAVTTLTELGKKLTAQEPSVRYVVNQYADETSLSFYSSNYGKTIELLGMQNLVQKQTRKGPWYTYRALNNEAKDGSPYLVRSTVDYQRALAKAKSKAKAKSTS